MSLFPMCWDSPSHVICPLGKRPQRDASREKLFRVLGWFWDEVLSFMWGAVPDGYLVPMLSRHVHDILPFTVYLFLCFVVSNFSEHYSPKKQEIFKKSHEKSGKTGEMYESCSYLQANVWGAKPHSVMLELLKDFHPSTWHLIGAA